MAGIKCKKYNASITVEAAYIVPVILMLVITLIFVLMIVHDRGIIYMELEKYAENICFNGMPIPEGEISDLSDINNRLFIYRINRARTRKEGGRLHVECYASSRVKPVLAFGSIAVLLDYRVDIRQKMNNRCKEVRKAVVLNE